MGELNGVTGVNRPEYPRYGPPAPQTPDNAQPPRQVLLVDHRGRPLVIREPRPVGFRKP